VETQLLRPRVLGTESIAHDAGPQPAHRPELGHFLEKIVVGVEEERDPLAEAVDVESGIERRLHVGDRVRQREGDLLDRRRSRFADVVAADRDGVPVRELALAECKNVGDDPERCARWIDVGPARDVLFQDVVLDRAGERTRRNRVPPRDGDVERQQDDCGRVNRHRRRHPIQRNAVEELRQILDGIDRDPDSSDLAGGKFVVRVVAHLGRQIEGDAQPADAVVQEIAVPPVGFGRRPESRVLPHRPQPAAVHGRLNAAGEGKNTGETDVIFQSLFWRDAS
jgi:hypothetical protein